MEGGLRVGRLGVAVAEDEVDGYVGVVPDSLPIDRAMRVVPDAPRVRKLGNFRYILIPEIINKFMTNISDPVRTKHVHVFKLNFK
jgi:hypothetical protein